MNSSIHTSAAKPTAGLVFGLDGETFETHILASTADEMVTSFGTFVRERGDEVFRCIGEPRITLSVFESLEARAAFRKFSEPRPAESWPDFEKEVRAILAASDDKMRQLIRAAAALLDGAGECPVELPPIKGELSNAPALIKAKYGRAFSLPDLRPGAVVSLDDAFGVRFARSELHAWRTLGARLMPHLEAALAAQGETPNPSTLSLQHALAELLRSPALTSPEQS
jgi:hypothetical protein